MTSLKTLRTKLIELSEQCENNEELEQLETEQNRLNELCREMYQYRTSAPPLTPTDRVRIELNHVIETITGEFVQMRRKMNIAQCRGHCLLLTQQTT